MTLNQYLDRWLELAARPKLRAKSYRDYRALLARYIRPALGERRLLSLTPLDIQGVCSRDARERPLAENRPTTPTPFFMPRSSRQSVGG